MILCTAFEITLISLVMPLNGQHKIILSLISIKYGVLTDQFTWVVDIKKKKSNSHRNSIIYLQTPS